MTAGRRLLLLRHGQTAWNESGRAQGHADIELDDRGHRQAAAAAEHLAHLGPVAIWSSDLARARQTSGYLEERTGLSAKYDERLREYDVGVRQGMTMDEFRERWPDVHAAWSRGEDARLPGAETAADVRARMLPALREMLDSLAPGDLGVVVSHGACLKVGLVALLGWPTAIEPTLRGVDNCAWAAVEEAEPGGRLRLAAYNETAGT